MNIIITGATGFIGKHLTASLSNNHNILAVSREIKDSAQNSYAIDLRNKDQVSSFSNQLAMGKRIDVIIHLASRFVTAGNINDLSVLYDNIKITENMVLLVKKVDANKLINFSTIAVYPNISGEFSETSTVRTSENTECIYGLSKICSENLFNYLLKENNISVVHLRLSQVDGEGMRNDRIIPIMMNELKNFNKITVFGNGERISNFIHINKVVSLVDMFVENDASGVYNLGDEHQSYFELAKILIEKYGNQESTIVKKNEGSRSQFILNISKLNEFMNKIQMNN